MNGAARIFARAREEAQRVPGSEETGDENMAAAQTDCKMREAAEQQRLLGIGTRDLENMKQKDLRKVAVSLGVSSRAKRKSTELLRKARKRDLAGQRMLAQFFASVSLRQALLARAPITGAAASGAGSAIQAAVDAAMLC